MTTPTDYSPFRHTSYLRLMRTCHHTIKRICYVMLYCPFGSIHIALQTLFDALYWSIRKIDIMCYTRKLYVINSLLFYYLDNICNLWINLNTWVTLFTMTVLWHDIIREIRNLYSRINILKRRFQRCSVTIKLMLSKSYCMCLYDAALWSKFITGTIETLRACYNQKIFWLFTHT